LEGAGLCRDQLKIHHKGTKNTKKLKPLSVTHNMWRRLCDLGVFVVNIAVQAENMTLQSDLTIAVTGVVESCQLTQAQAAQFGWG
jgi:hypothetical protein